MKRYLGLVTAIVALSVACTPAWAWWSTGHMVVAQIAYGKLNEHTKREVDRLCALGSEPNVNTFVTASVWADDLKAVGVHAYDHWHYIDYPFSTDGTPTEEATKVDNAEWAIKECIASLRNPRCPDVEKARMLKFLIHFVGDVHMPLHAAGRFSKETPMGDAGGNKYTIMGGKYRNLHAYWDAGAGLFEDVARPLTGDGEKAIKALADEAITANPESGLTNATGIEVHAWLMESFEVAKNVCYTTPMNEAPNDDYKAVTQKTCRTRVTLAGYRLAALLNDIFKPKTPKL